MAQEDAAIQRILFSKWSISLVIASCSYFILCKLKLNIYQKLYAAFMSRVDGKLMTSRRVCAIKQDLFNCIEKDSLIVEIGAGSGANFQFYPTGCSVMCIEPKLAFESYVKESLQKNGAHLQTVEFLEGFGENLGELLEPETVDYVTCSLVLCSVRDVKTVAEQVKKVLKPGGKFFFFEHVLAGTDNRWIQRYQKIMDASYVYSFVGDNCHMGREPWLDISEAGFSELDWKRVTTNAYPFSCIRTLGIGIATK